MIVGENDEIIRLVSESIGNNCVFHAFQTNKSRPQKIKIIFLTVQFLILKTDSNCKCHLFRAMLEIYYCCFHFVVLYNVYIFKKKKKPK